MPIVQIFTSLARSRVPAHLGKQVAVALSQTLRGKSLDKMLVHIATDQSMFCGWQGDQQTGPTTLTIVRAIGAQEVEDNRKTVKVLTDLLTSQLAIPPTEVRLVFNDIAPEMIGLNGQIAKDLFASK